MTKSPVELVLALKKANKTAREIMARKAGFPNAQIAILNGGKLGTTTFNTSTPKKKKKSVTGSEVITPTIHNVHIVDASGSMQGGKIKSANDGIRQELLELYKDKNINYLVTIVSFSYSEKIKTIVNKTPIGEVKFENIRTDGLTALYDAIGFTLEGLRASIKEGDKVLVKIFTDGGENASTSKYKSSSVLSSYIKECENHGFTITFVGTAEDVRNVQLRLSIDDSNTLVHDNTAKGVADSFNMAAGATMSYSSAVLRGENVTKGFYKKAGKLS